MHRLAAALAAAVFLCACAPEPAQGAAPSARIESEPTPAAAPEPASDAGGQVEARELAEVRMPLVSDKASASNDWVGIDAENSAQGCFSVDCRYTGSKRLKLGVAKGESTYFYDLFVSDEPQYFPLQMGSGGYTITVYEQVEGERYAAQLELSAQVELSSEFAPFLLPGQFVSYTPESEAVDFGLRLTDGAANDLERVSRVFGWIIENVDYDYAKAAVVPSGYLPDVDDTLDTRTGICFDYASLLAAMLRSQGIPAKLVTGYVLPKGEYHAWNMIYITDVGWVAKLIRFDGKSWQLGDATFAASGGVADGYEPVYEY